MMDFKKISETVKLLGDQNLSPYEMSAVGKMISGAAETMIYKDIVDEAKKEQNFNIDNFGSTKLN